MRLLFVTDNGFCEDKGEFFYSRANEVLIQNLRKYFDKYTIVARASNVEKKYLKVPDYYKVVLVKKQSLIKLWRVLDFEINECDAVLCFGLNGFFASCIGKMKNKTVIAYCGGDPYEFVLAKGKSIGRKFGARVVRYLERGKFRNASFGHYCDSYFFDKFPTKGLKLACSSVDVICDHKNLKKRLEHIDNSLNVYKIGLIGYLNAIKGIDLAIKAIAELGDLYTIEFVGRGDPVLYESLAAELGCENRVRFLGEINSKQELYLWIDSLDIYIQPSRAEGMPRATIEAMSRGCPVVASDAGAIHKLIDEQYIFRNGDAKILAEKILFLSDKSRMEEAAKRNFEQSKEYDSEKRDRRYREFYSTVVKHINSHTQSEGK